MKLFEVKRIHRIGEIVPNSPQHRVLRGASNGQSRYTLMSIQDQFNRVGSRYNPFQQVDTQLGLLMPLGTPPPREFDYDMALTPEGKQILSILDAGDTIQCGHLNPTTKRITIPKRIF